MIDLPEAWLAPNGGDRLWGAQQHVAYKVVPCALLPPLHVDGSFAWLRQLPPGMEPIALVHEGEEDPSAVAEQLSNLVAEAARLELRVPDSFITFMSGVAFAGRVPNYVGCYFELEPQLAAVPGHDGPERMLHFLRDPQVCVWSLLLEPGRGHRVVYSHRDYRNLPNLVGTTVCAPDFETFLRRFSLESMLAHALLRNDPVDGELKDYLEAATRSQATLP